MIARHVYIVIDANLYASGVLLQCYQLRKKDLLVSILRKPQLEVWEPSLTWPNKSCLDLTKHEYRVNFTGSAAYFDWQTSDFPTDHFLRVWFVDGRFRAWNTADHATSCSSNGNTKFQVMTGTRHCNKISSIG
jgi:hypothetical protein